MQTAEPQSADDIIASLRLTADGCWSARIGAITFVFPATQTRAEVESVLREAWAVQGGS